MSVPRLTPVSAVSLPLSPEPVGVAGRGRIAVARTGGRSRVTRAYAASPLRILTPRNHGPAAWIYTSTFGGGMVGGDAFDVDVEIGAGAMALLSTQAATKVYRSSRATSMHLAVALSRDATLVVAPDPVVCFAGSSYRQIQQFDLHQTANLIFVDWLSSGRHAAGERWQFDRYESRVLITRGGRPILNDAVLLSPAHGRLAARLGRFDVLLVAVLIGPSLEAVAAEIVAGVERLPVESRSPLIVGASRLAGGCVLRMAGTSLEDAGSMLGRLLGFVPSLLGDDPWARKW